MRRLILMRHAKSDWSGSGVPKGRVSPVGSPAEGGKLDDHERPLNARGRKSAPVMARALAGRGWVPEAVCSSDSARTTETWARMEAELPGAAAPQWVRGLYLAGPSAILEVAAGLPAQVGCALLLGHNPGISEAASLLARHAVELRTADAVLFEAEGADWRVVLTASAWRLVEVLRSRDEG